MGIYSEVPYIKKKKARRSEKNKTPPDLGEALVTEYPYEVVGVFFVLAGA